MRRLAVILFVLVACAATVHAAPTATLFRLYLTDGTHATSYGEYARVGSDVVFSMPVAGTDDDPKLQLVTLPASSVDWVRTERYSDAARADRYATTKGDEDFIQLNNEVARVLNDIAASSNRAQALALAQRAHEVLAQWPADHYHYRDSDVRDIQSIVDATIAGLRGQSANAFQLSLVATTADAGHVPVDGMPTPKERLDQLVHVADVTPRAEDRVALLQASLAVLAEPVRGLTADAAAALRTTLAARVQHEVEVDRQYARLGQQVVAAGQRAAASARVADVERAIARLASEDQRLGGERPDTVNALEAELRAKLNDAQRLRLLRDQWLVRRSAYAVYEDRVGASLLTMVRARPMLEAIRHLEGPAPDQLLAWKDRLTGGAARLERVKVPPELQPAHDLLVSAWRFAENAAANRDLAIRTGSMATAWSASSAAAGALMLFSQAQADIRTVLEIPRLK